MTSEPAGVGFDYELDDDAIRRYRAKPPELRLQWLYMGALLRRASPARTKELQDRFRAPAPDKDPVSRNGSHE
ncbi:MAG: hypothetical protein R6V85_00625 [Polyangia bacterium]